MKWMDPMPIDCPACGNQFPIPVEDLRSLSATCPNCGASFKEIGERMLASENQTNQLLDLFLIVKDLEEHDGPVLSNSELDSVNSLEELVCAVANHFPPDLDRMAKAKERVMEAVRRIDKDLVGTYL